MELQKYHFINIFLLKNLYRIKNRNAINTLYFVVVEYCIGIVPVLKRFDTGMIKIYFIMETSKGRYKNIFWNGAG